MPCFLLKISTSRSPSAANGDTKTSITGEKYSGLHICTVSVIKVQTLASKECNPPSTTVLSPNNDISVIVVVQLKMEVQTILHETGPRTRHDLVESMNKSTVITVVATWDWLYSEVYSEGNIICHDCIKHAECKHVSNNNIHNINTKKSKDPKAES